MLDGFDLTPKTGDTISRFPDIRCGLRMLSIQESILQIKIKHLSAPLRTSRLRG